MTGKMLVIAEKPSVAKSLAKVLGAYRNKEGYLDGSRYIVSWCFGHLAEYAAPDEYDEKYRKWDFSDLPIIPAQWKLVVGRDKAKQFGILKNLLHRKDMETVVNACDAGREGELIFWNVYELAQASIPVKRLWISSMEESAITDGFIKELKLELALHPDNMEFGVLKDEAAIHKAVFDVTGDASGEGNPFYIDELGKDAPDSVKGRILNLETGGLTEYRRSEDYLASVEERLILSPDQFSFETVTDNSAVWKELDDHVCGAVGFFDRNGIEKSLSRPKVTGFVALSEYLNQRIWTDAEVQAKQTAVQSGMDRGRNRDEATKKMMRAAKAVPQEKSRDMVKVKTSKKRFVLARLAEKQQIVKDRENAKHMGKIYPQHEHGTEDLPFPEAVKKTASKIPQKER